MPWIPSFLRFFRHIGDCTSTKPAYYTQRGCGPQHHALYIIKTNPGKKQSITVHLYRFEHSAVISTSHDRTLHIITNTRHDSTTHTYHLSHILDPTTTIIVLFILFESQPSRDGAAFCFSLLATSIETYPLFPYHIIVQFFHSGLQTGRAVSIIEM